MKTAILLLLLTGCGFEMKLPPTTVCVVKGELMCNQATVYECTGLVWKWRADCDEATCNYEVRPNSNQWGKCSIEAPGGDL